jgi:hypothetical protein
MNTALKSLPEILTMESPPLAITCICGRIHVQAIREVGIRDTQRRPILERAAYVLGWMLLHDVWICRQCWEGDMRSEEMEHRGRYQDAKHRRDDELSAWRRGR